MDCSYTLKKKWYIILALITIHKRQKARKRIFLSTLYGHYYVTSSITLPNTEREIRKEKENLLMNHEKDFLLLFPEIREYLHLYFIRISFSFARLIPKCRVVYPSDWKSFVHVIQ